MNKSKNYFFFFFSNRNIIQRISITIQYLWKIHVVAKGLTMHGDHDASTGFMISYSTKVAHSPLISSNSTREYVFLSPN